MLATLGIGTLSSAALPIAHADTRSLLVTFTSDKNSVLFSEQSGQDITLVAGSHRILFQCKHSSNPVNEPVDMSEFRSVLEGFAHSLLLAEENPGPAVGGCILLTNRLPHEAVAEVKTVVQRCRDALGWQNGQINQIAQDASAYKNLLVDFRKQKRGFQGTIEALVTDWLSDKDRKGNVVDSPEDKLVRAALRVLPAFYFLTEAHQSQFEESFTRFARRYGATEAETENAVSAMLGRMLQASGQSRALTLGDFVKAITGRADAKEMTPAGICGPCAESWKRWVADRGARPDWTVPRRTVQSEISRSFLEGKRIIFLVGSGGCGKTEALLEATAQRLDRFTSATGFPGFVAVKGCPEVKLDWLETAVGEWANRGEPPYQKVDRPIVRLSTANPDLPLLLSLGLDGLDEEFPSRETLDALIHIIRQRADTLLVLTVRGSEYKDVSRYIHRYRTSPSLHPSDPDVGLVIVDEFDDEELLAALAAGAGRDLSDEVRGLFSEDGRNTGVSLVSLASSYGGRAGSASGGDTLTSSLKHPRMLGAFIIAEQHRSGTILDALNGDDAAKGRVAKVFLSHFLSKYEHRRQANNLPSAHDFAVLIKQIATATANSPTASTETSWPDAAAHIGTIERSRATQLFDEAASGGLIFIVDETASPREWEWKHPFVSAYVASVPVREFLPQ